MRRNVIPIICLLLLITAGQLSAACDAEVTRTQTAGTYYGQSVAVIGDINNDFVPDYIVGAPNGTAVPINTSGLGRAYVYSGADPQGSYIFSYSGQYYTPSLGIQNGQFGYCVAGAGDVNGDGYPDFMMGAPNWREESTYWLATGRVMIFEGNPLGSYGSLSFPLVARHGKYRVGTSLASIGDITGDGRDEIIVGAPKDLAIDGNNGMAWVYSYQFNESTQNNEWVEVYELDGVNPERLFGKVVSGAGDVDNDDVPDFMVAGPAYGAEQGIVIVYSGATGAAIWTLTGQSSYVNLGRVLSPLGDVNGDNYDDFIVGENGTIHVYSGQTGTVLHSYSNGNPTFGTAATTAGDYNDDGIPDVLISMPEYSSMHIFSGAANTLLANVDASGTGFGTSLAGPTGTQSDGYGITVSGAPGSDQAYVFSCGFPDADIVADPQSGNRPLTVDFTANSSPDVTVWDWDFGDGGNAAVEDPTHEYLSSGNFSVALTMTGYKGQRTETLGDPIVVNPVLPVASFSATPQGGERPLTVYFVEASQGNPDTWYWDFGDGQDSYEQEPVHIYQAPGQYTVSLTVTNQDGENTQVRPNFVTVTYRTIWVDDDGDDVTGDGSELAPYATIQKGIDESLEGDTVMVKAGTYTGVGNRDIQFPDYYIYVVSEAGAASTIIDAEGADRAFNFVDRDALIKGFTIQNGDRNGFVDKTGGAMFILGDPTIEDCVIKSCSAERGAGIYVGVTPGSQATIRNVLFYDNTATIAGGAVYVSDATALIENCTMADNAAVSGAAVAVSNLGTATLNNCLLAFNNYDGLNCEGAGASVTFDCCVFWEHTGGHVTGSCTFPSDPTEAIAADPQFCDRDFDDYGVYLGSPCDPEESQCGELVGALPATCTDLDDWAVEMGRLDAGYMGFNVQLPVYITPPQIPTDIDHVQIRFRWNLSVMSFLGVTPGDFLNDCGWDYWTYRYKTVPTTHLLFEAYAQTGGDPPTCYQPAGKQKLCDINFYLTTQTAYADDWYPVEFYWPQGIEGECEPNTFDEYGTSTILMADDVYTYYDYLIPPGTPNMTPPTSCNGFGNPAIDFYNGYIYLVDIIGPGPRGDLNLNSIRYEVGDAVLFTCALVYSPEECFTTDYITQLGASDIDCDGDSLTIVDYDRLLGIIIGDLTPECPGSLPKIATTFDTVKVLSTTAVRGQHNKPVEISLANQEELSAFQAHITYNDLALDPVSDPNCQSGNCVQYELMGRAAGYDNLGQVLVKNTAPGELLVYFIPDDDRTVSIPAGSGSILKVYFDVPSLAPLGAQPYQPVDESWKLNRLSTLNAEGIVPELIAGSIWITRPLPPPSCPVLYSFDGSEYRQFDPMLTACEQFGYQEVVTDHYQLPVAPALTESGVHFQFRELEDEVTYLKDVQLMTVDHQPNSTVAVSVDGQVMTYESSAMPISAYDHTGQDRLAEVAALDGNLFKSDEPGYLVVSFANSVVGTKGYRTNTAAKYKCEVPIEIDPDWSEGGDPDNQPQLSFEMLDAEGNWQPLPEMPSRVSDRQEVLITRDVEAQVDAPVTLRISWADSYQTDAVVQLLPTDEKPVVQYWQPSQAAAQLLDSQRQSWSSFAQNGTLSLHKGDVLDFSFEPEATAAGMVRDYVVVATGRYEPDVAAYADAVPTAISLNENYPNPFNPTTTISYSLPRASAVRLEVFNVMGQQVTTLIDQYQAAGVHQIEWNASGVASGVYFYRLTVDDFVQTKKMILTK